MIDFESQRLYVRNFKPEDWKDLHEYLCLPEIYRFEPGMPLTEDECREEAVSRSGSDHYLAVVLKQTGKMIGHLSFHAAPPEYTKTFTAGYIINPAYQKKGYATEAVKELSKYAFRVLGLHKISAYCSPDNLASVRVLEKTGFIREGLLRQNIYFRKDFQDNPLWLDSFIYGLLEGDLKTG